MIKIQSISVLVFALLTGFLAACDGKPTESTAKVGNNSGDTARDIVFVSDFKADFPADLAKLTLSDAKVPGTCFLDSLNGSLLGDKPTVIKSGTKIALDGWAVYDTNPATLGAVVGVQLISKKQSFFTTAISSYGRLGLGAELGNAKLDGGGVLVKDVYLSVPAGEYRVLFLTRSGDDVRRCDTSRVLNVE